MVLVGSRGGTGIGEELRLRDVVRLDVLLGGAWNIDTEKTSRIRVCLLPVQYSAPSIQ
jgi:hypothetical protein